MITDNLVMWETRPGIVDWVYFKTQTLREILMTLNQLREESYVSSDVERLFPKAECAKSKHECLTIQLNLKLFLWTLVCEWMESLLSIYGLW